MHPIESSTIEPKKPAGAEDEALQIGPSLAGPQVTTQAIMVILLPELRGTVQTISIQAKGLASLLHRAAFAMLRGLGQVTGATRFR